MKRKRHPRCGSLNTQRRGSYSARVLTSRGEWQRKVQRYYCLDCHTSFSERAEFKATKRYEPFLILKAADATTVFIQGEKNQLLLAADVESQDIPDS